MFTRNGLFAGLALASLAALPACSNWHNPVQPPSAMAPPAPVAQQEVAPEMVRRVQTALQHQGFYQGNIDGIWGPETRSALGHYQYAHNLPANGELTSATVAALLPAASAAPMPPPTNSAAANPAFPAAAPPPPSPIPQ